MILQDNFVPSEFEYLSQFDANCESNQLLKASLDDRFRNFFALPSGTCSADGSAIIGEAGYLFVNDGSNNWSKQLSGDTIIDPAIAEAGKEALASIARTASKLGIRFALVIYPEKDIVYPEFSPNVRSSVVTSRSIHQLFSEEFDIIYSADLMVKAKFRTQLYHRRNSHVNFYGGLGVTNHVLDALGLKAFSINDVPSDLVSWPDDLSIKWVDGLNTFRRRVTPTYDRNTLWAPDNGHVGTHVQITNTSASNPDTVLVFGDSYSWNPDAGLISFLAHSYRKVYFVWTKKVDWDLVQNISPNILLLQSAERFLIKGLSL